ncbi:ATP-binding protein [Saccharothrix sp. NPDC042600]|uniref:ATP-binding protein n=1 Tax=Saccharothrix TaxID=2071 RepID=UPI0033D263AA
MRAGGHPERWRAGVLETGGEMGALVSSFDWAASPLGPVETWPQSLRTAVGVCLTSRFPILLWWGPELVMIYNDAYRPILGASKHPRALGAPGKDVWPEIWDVIGPMLDGVLAGRGATWSDDQLLLLDRNGFTEECYFTFSYSPIVDESGSTGGVFCAVTETTEKIVGERRLRTLGALAADLVDAPSAEDACRRTAHVLASNAEDIRFAEVHLADATGRPVARTGDCPDEAWPVAEALRTGRSTAVFADPDATSGPAAAYVVPVVEPGRSTPSAVLVVGTSDRRPFDAGYRSFLDLVAGHLGTGIGGARGLEAERRRARALAELDAAKTTFFSDISHELRTPLTLIAGPVQDALTDPVHPLPDAHRERLRLVARNAGRLRRLVNGMLDFARIEAGRLSPERTALDLASATRAIALTFAEAMRHAGLRLHVDTPALPRPAHIDPDMWDRIVLNLLSNALKYTLRGDVRVELRDTGDGARLRVADTGIGIPADELPRLFERFHRVRGAHGRSHEGSGIGLALVAELVRLLDGTITVESTPGSGSVFTVHVPYGEAGPASAPRARSTDPAPYLDEALSWTTDPRPTPATTGGRDRLLVVEDNHDLRDYLLGLLDGHYDVELAEDGADALDRVRRARPDLVLADVMMPRLDGFGLLAAIRTDPALRDLPVVLLSARAGEEAAAEGFAAGADDYLVKPFSAADLLTRLRANLERARARSRDVAWRAAVVRSLHDGVFVADATGTLVEVNDAFERITGLTRKDPSPVPEVTDDERELLVRHRDGHDVWLTVTTTVVADHRDEPLVVGMVRDITRDRDHRSRRAAATRLAAALNTPLPLAEVYATSVHGFSETFGGTVLIADGRQWPPATVVTEVGSAAWARLPERTRRDWAAGRRQPQDRPDVLPGLHIAVPAGSVWVQFPAPRTVSADEHLLAAVLADALAAALDRARQDHQRTLTEDQLRTAVASHRLVGQAVGILMERHGLTASTAFDRLRTASQHRNVKLRDVAEHVVHTGENP